MVQRHCPAFDELIKQLMPGYYLARSRSKRGCYVLWTAISKLTVVDVDHALEGARGALGWTKGERGGHVYLPAGADSLEQDKLYRELSHWRGAWCERLFDRDGITPRELPVGEAIDEHRRAWAIALQEAITHASREREQRQRVCLLR